MPLVSVEGGTLMPSVSPLCRPAVICTVIDIGTSVEPLTFRSVSVMPLSIAVAAWPVR